MISITQQKPLICDVNVRKTTFRENLFKRQRCLKKVKLGNYMKTVSRVISVHISISIEAVVAVPSVESYWGFLKEVLLDPLVQELQMIKRLFQAYRNIQWNSNVSEKLRLWKSGNRD